MSFSSTARLLSSQSIKTASLVCLAVSVHIQPPRNIKIDAIRLTTAVFIENLTVLIANTLLSNKKSERECPS